MNHSSAGVVVLLMQMVSVACGGRSGMEGEAIKLAVSGGKASVSAGGAESTGGDANTGGATAIGGSSTTQCTGDFDRVGPGGLCISQMIRIIGPDPGSAYQIDITEVTKGQYKAWLATNPPLPPKTDAYCGWKTSYEHPLAAIDETYGGTDADAHPVENVDWCDARAYCTAVGKRLCGAIGGGSLSAEHANDASRAEWYRACSSGGKLMYPYGSDYQPISCNGAEYWRLRAGGIPQTTRVGSMHACTSSTSGFTTVYDLSGNVLEWEDSCTTPGTSASCLLRGGSLGSSGEALTCTRVVETSLSTYDRNIGFRCCSL